MDFTDLNESMGAFESAVSSSKVHVRMPACGTVLLAVDGSNQDATAIALAAIVAPRLRAKVRVTMGHYPTAGKTDRAPVDRARKALEGKVDVDVVFEDGALPFAQICAAKEKVDAGLVIVPAPYIGDIGELKDESLSSTIDLLLAELRTALLVVRHPIDDISAHLRRLVLPMTLYTPALSAAAGWAFALAEGDATLDLYAVADQPAVEAAAQLTGEGPESGREASSSDALMRAEHKLAGGLISAVQHKASETGVNVDVDLAAGDPVSLTLGRIHRGPSLAIVGAPMERTAAEFHHVHDILLGCKYPVLIARD